MPPPQIEDYALIGDCQTAVLAGATGLIAWLCRPGFGYRMTYLRDQRDRRWHVAAGIAAARGDMVVGPQRAKRQASRAICAGTLLAGLLTLTACDRPDPPAHLRIAGGDAERGRLLIQRYRCGSCHGIEGIRGGNGIVGPPLTDYAQRVLLAGIVPNVPRTLVPWLIDPPAMAPETAMPNLGVTEPEARDIATYLYTLGAEKVRLWRPEASSVRAAGDRDTLLRGAIPIERAMELVVRQAEPR